MIVVFNEETNPKKNISAKKTFTHLIMHAKNYN